MSRPEEETWSLSELPPNLAALTCEHIVDQDRKPHFVDYNGGHLTIFCAKGEDHEDEAEYRMVCLSDILSAHPEVQRANLVGGYSRATKSSDGSWKTTLQEPYPEEEEK